MKSGGKMIAVDGFEIMWKWTWPARR